MSREASQRALQHSQTMTESEMVYLGCIVQGSCRGCKGQGKSSPENLAATKQSEQENSSKSQTELSSTQNCYRTSTIKSTVKQNTETYKDTRRSDPYTRKNDRNCQ
jgi:hypothetical protein